MPESPAADWYTTWFDSPHYHRLYGHRSTEEARHFIQALHTHFQWNQLQLVDLACGAGRHAAAAAELGHKVTGLDLSANSIEQAHETWPVGPKLTFRQADMRDFELDQPADGVLNLFTSFGYFTDPEDHGRALNQIHLHLKPGGFLILDFLNVKREKSRLVAEETIQKEGTSYRIERSLKSLDSGFDAFIKRIEFEEDGQTRRHEEMVTALDKDTLTSMLHTHGFEVQAVFGDYHLQPWSADESPRLILHALKQ